MKPSVGRIVHFMVLGTSECKAAIVTEVENPTLVNLTVFGTHSLSRRTSVPYSEDGHTGTWHWPERVD